MRKISRKQAEILRHLLSYGAIKQRLGGHFNENEERVNFKSLDGLFLRGMITDHIRQTQPTCGLISSPVFYTSSVTEKGKDAYRQFVAALRYPDFRRDWEAPALEEEC